MGRYADTAIVDYRLSFADQGKQTFIFCFLLQQTNRSLPFPFSKWKLPFSVSSVFCIHIYSIYMLLFQMENGKQKMEAQAIFLHLLTPLLIVKTEVYRLSVC
jgi:hypothetical protein